MIKDVVVTNHLGESIVLDMRFPEKSGFLIESIDGLGPGKAIINTTEVLTRDGSLYNSAKVNSRNILMSLMFLSDSSIESIRQKSYKYFPIKKRIKLLFNTDNRSSVIYGYVESNEPNIFSKDEKTTISIICPDPYFYSTSIKETIFSGIESLFEFPFSNESSTLSLIEFGSLNLQTTQTVYYSGDSEIGVIVYIHFLGTASNIDIYNTTTREQMSLNTTIFESIVGSPIESGDDIVISTVKGNKYIYLIRDGEQINILNCLDKNSSWFHLVKGDNIFAYTADIGLVNMQFRIQNQIVYEGI